MKSFRGEEKRRKWNPPQIKWVINSKQAPRGIQSLVIVLDQFVAQLTSGRSD